MLYKNVSVEGQIVWRPAYISLLLHAEVQQLELETRKLNLELGTSQRLYDAYGSTIRGASSLNRHCFFCCQDSSARVISAVGPVTAVWKVGENT